MRPSARSTGSTVLRALAGLVLTALSTGTGLFLGLLLIGPCPQIQPRVLVPVLGFGPAVLGLLLGLAATFLLLRTRRPGPRPPAS
jgi:hypothetical protein